MSRLATLRRIVADKEAEIAHLRAQLAAAEAYLSSLRESLGKLEEPREEARATAADPLVEVRALIRDAGQPLYIDEILRGLGHPLTRETREELRGLLRPWLRRGEVFTRPRPSTYGLVESRSRPAAARAQRERDSGR